MMKNYQQSNPVFVVVVAAVVVDDVSVQNDDEEQDKMTPYDQKKHSAEETLEKKIWGFGFEAQQKKAANENDVDFEVDVDADDWKKRTTELQVPQRRRRDQKEECEKGLQYCEEGTVVDVDFDFEQDAEEILHHYQRVVAAVVDGIGTIRVYHRRRSWWWFARWRDTFEVLGGYLRRIDKI